MHPGIHARQRPNKIAFMQSDGKASVTYAELNRQSNQTAHWLFNFGLRVRDGVAILLDNDLRFLIIAWAAQRSGLYYTPISTLFQAQEIRWCHSFSLFVDFSYCINDNSVLCLP